ncbi:aldose epimerase family protein [Deinococcus humi]|uniref:Aldose 1-epimerase n=1 Tax=Deinococcus humi TaxID=662880 RepID=A0A7W8NGG6_9DEIO|nr:aldose epimerase family protein [Deinococcus humi]MBB5365506.1 aldose 1-epimerase [Deinococcus humi]GGO37578.1 aldose 1-epimerase [Deinococcus humi]
MSSITDLETRHWGTLPDGQDVQLFVLRAANGLTVTLGEYGARLLRVQVPDRHGRPGDVLLGHPDLEAYLEQDDALYFGATIGRVANRIARGRFELEGEAYQLAINNAPNHLHGGPGGFHAVRWQGEALPDEEGGVRGVVFRYRSPDGEEGYPGAVDVTARYTLSDDGVLTLDCWAEPDAPTPISMTNHAYWNLADGGAGSVLGQTLTLAAEQFLAVDDTAIPEALRTVAGTPFDFRTAKPLGQDIEVEDQQFQRTGGYDHHFVLPDVGGELRHAGTLHDPVSGRQMEIWTTENGVQLYSGNFLSGQMVGWDGARYGWRSAVCLETQQAPDAVNQPLLDRLGTGSSIVQPTQRYHTQTQLRFSAQPE